MHLKLDVYIHNAESDEPGTTLAEKLDRLVTEVKRIGKLMATQNESIAALKAAVETFKAAVTAGLDNIAKDEAAILAKLATLGDLSPENQAVVDSVVSDLNAVKTRVEELAASIPDETVVEP